MPIDLRFETRREISEATQVGDQSAIKNRQLKMYLLLVFIHVDVFGVDDVVFTAGLTGSGSTGRR